MFIYISIYYTYILLYMYTLYMLYDHIALIVNVVSQYFSLMVHLVYIWVVLLKITKELLSVLQELLEVIVIATTPPITLKYVHILNLRINCNIFL